MRTALVLFLIAFLMPAHVPAQGAYFDPSGCNPRNCSESGWIYDENSRDHTTVWRHNLGSTPRAVSILFSPDPDQSQATCPAISDAPATNASVEAILLTGTSSRCNAIA